MAILFVWHFSSEKERKGGPVSVDHGATFISEPPSSVFSRLIEVVQ